MTLTDFAVGLLMWLMVAVNAVPPNNCPLLELNHGYFVAEETSSAFPDKLFYACEPDFKPSVGHWWGVITCTDGEWSSKPNCIPIQLNPPPSDKANCMDVTRDNCGPIMPIANGTGEPVDGNSVRYSCQRGYSLQGSATVVCFRNGEWSNPPVCNAHGPAVVGDTSLGIPGPEAPTIYMPVVPASVPTQPSPPNRSKTSTIHMLDGPASVPTQPSPPKRSETLTIPRRVVPASVPTQPSPPKRSEALIENCGNVPNIPNARPVPYAWTVLYYCNRGYQLRGSISWLNCYTDRSWSTPRPHCEAIPRPVAPAFVPAQPSPASIDNCGDVPNIPNARPELYAWSVLYHCNRGYQLWGSVSRLYCYTDRSWSTPAPHCEACPYWRCW